MIWGNFISLGRKYILFLSFMCDNHCIVYCRVNAAIVDQTRRQEWSDETADSEAGEDPSSPPPRQLIGWGGR